MARKIVSAFQGVQGHAPPEIFKIKGPGLATNAFPEILAWKS